MKEKKDKVEEKRKNPGVNKRPPNYMKLLNSLICVFREISVLLFTFIRGPYM